MISASETQAFWGTFAGLMIAALIVAGFIGLFIFVIGLEPDDDWEDWDDEDEF